MASINEILGKNIDSVKALKAEIRSLQDSLVGLDAESQEFKDTTTKLTAAQDELTKVTKAGKQENDAAKDSIVGMKNEYKALYDQYKLLSEEQRNSDFGKNMAASLETLSSKINETQKGVGNFKDNIGNYAGSISDAFNKMGISVGALKGPLDTAKAASGGLNVAFKTLAANPIMLAITAIVAILAKAADAIKNNEELTNRLHQAMAAFKPIIDAVSNAFDFLAGIIVKVVEGMAKVGEKILSIIPGYKKAAESHKELAKATDELTKRQRELNVANSEKQAEIERLREEASATDDVVEKQRLLQEAKEKQAEVDQANIEIAQEELRILQEYGEKTANSAEENEKLAAAQKKVNDAIAQGERNQRMYNKQLDATNKSTKTATSSAKNYREEAKKLYEQVIEDNKDEITKLTEKYVKEKKLLEKYHYDTTLLTKKYNADVFKIERDAAAKKYDQRRADNEQELELWRSRGKGEIALALEAEKLENKTIPTVKKLDETVTNFLSSFRDDSKMPDLDAVFAKMKEMEDFINDNTFEALGDEFKEIKDAVQQVNDEFGLSITTVSNLNLTVEELQNRLEQVDKEYNDFVTTKAGEEAIKRIDESLRDSKISLFNEIFSFDPSSVSFEGLRQYMMEGEYLILEEQKTLYEQELAEFEGTQDQKLELLQQYYAIVDELDARHQALSELNQQRTQEMVDNLADAMDNIGSSLSTVKSSYESLIDSEVKAGKIDEKQANEKKKRLAKLEIAQQAFAIATIAADAASGLFSIWKGYATEVGTVNPQTAAAAGPASAGVLAGLNAKSLVSAIAKSAGLAATATAQIMAAKNGIVTAVNGMSESGGGGSDVGVAASPMVIDSTSYSYAREIQTQSDIDEINNRQYFVSVVDIESALNQKVKVTEESSF